MYVLRNYIEKSPESGGLGRMAVVMTTFTDELIEELGDYDELAIRAFMFQIGEVISWIGHGDNEQLPDVVKPFAELVQPSERAADAGTTEATSNDAHDSDGSETASVVAGLDGTSGMSDSRPGNIL